MPCAARRTSYLGAMAARDRITPRRNRATPVVTPRNRPRQGAPAVERAAGPDDPDEKILAIAERCYAALPADFRRYADNVVVTIQDFPDADTLARMGCATRWDLLGLYSGIAVGEKEAGYVAPTPDRVFLYARPIAAYAKETGERLADVVRHVLIHEIGHHFGLSDADMERIEAACR